MIYGSKIFNFCNDLYFRLSSPFTPISPISNCWQHNICGSLCSWMTKCYICFRDLPKAEVFGWSILPKHLAKVFGKTQIISVFCIGSNFQTKVCNTKQTFPSSYLSKINLNGYQLFFNQNSAQATCQTMTKDLNILTFGLHWISKIGLQWIPDLLVLNITFHKYMF